MALGKSIIGQIGQPLTYHRILSINKITNQSTIISILSYIDENAREAEKQGDENVYKERTEVILDYEEISDIVDAYFYLKTSSDIYEDSEDV